MLRKRGHTIAIANNGQEALEMLEAHRFDIVLMDVQMPVMNGYEATQKIRQKEKLTGNHMIIIGLTASNMKGDKEKCLQAGMDDFVSKPMRIKDLMQAIASVAPER
jgi:CheY-like chemotaxis protein